MIGAVNKERTPARRDTVRIGRQRNRTENQSGREANRECAEGEVERGPRSDGREARQVKMPTTRKAILNTNPTSTGN